MVTVLVLIGAILATICALACVLNPHFEIVRNVRPFAGLVFLVYLVFVSCIGVLS
jgi:NADH:ubiquinone oxidoreductase subunit 6 (subunit J)